MQFEKLDRPGHGSEKSVANAATNTNTIACSRKYTASEQHATSPVWSGYGQAVDGNRVTLHCYLSFVELNH